MRILKISFTRNTDELKHLLGLVHGLEFADVIMKANDLHDLVADRHDRVQGCHGILEDHRDIVAADLTDFMRTLLADVLAVQNDLAADDASGRIRNQIQDGKCCCRLACAGLADQSHTLALVDREADTVDRLAGGCSEEIFDDQILNC